MFFTGFMNCLEEIISELNELKKDTDSYIGGRPDSDYAPSTWPHYRDEYRQWIISYCRDRNKELPKGFWSKTKRQLKGMYYGINSNHSKNRDRYITFLSGFESIFLGQLTSLEDIREKNRRISRMPYDDLKECYEEAIILYDRIKEYAKTGRSSSPVFK
jgi:hypothetical protein